MMASSTSPGFSWPPLPGGNAPLIIAPPHLSEWANRVENFLKGKVRPDILGFATSGSSGAAPKAILFTPEALEHCALGAIRHMGAETGDWLCPLPLWHIGGVMTVIRSSLAGTRVFYLKGKWNPDNYTQHLEKTKAAWSSLVPTQVVDLVQNEISAPSHIRSILVGGGSLDLETGKKARVLGWPIVQSYGMTEAGSQIATACPNEPFHTDRLTILPHWEVKTGERGCLAIRGKGRFFGIVSTKEGNFSLEEIPENIWWENNDIVEIDGRMLTFIRRADRVVKIMGELVDPDAIEETLRHQFGHIVIDILPHPRNAYQLVACHPDGELLKKACFWWNTSCTGFQKIAFLAQVEIPRNKMGKIDRLSLNKLIAASLEPI